ncbi:MAG: hypothetical protein JXN61_05690, partial [Sedimentisphaerales bacterium]|nr:hypothetical protein [Sedimentisphaerales bacterium]
MEERRISRILAAVIVSALCSNSAALGAIMTYEFDAGQSKVIKTGADTVEYAVEGRLEILVDCDIW